MTNDIRRNSWSADAVNPADADVLLSTKESGTGISSGQYIFANPAYAPRTQVWGMDLISTNSMTAGEFLCLDPVRACCVFERSPMTVEVSREHSDYFTRNMAALLCETRLALCIFNSSAIIHGGWPFGS